MRFANGKTLATIIVSATLAGAASMAQAVVYPIIFDPQFDGTVRVDLPNDAGCRALGDNVWDTTLNPVCQLNLVAPFDVFAIADPSVHYFPASGVPQLNIAPFVQIYNGAFNSFQATIDLIDAACPGDCNTVAQLQFDVGGVNAGNFFPGTATLTIFDGPTWTNSYRVPEPGSLALLLGAVGAGWVARRRKSAA